MTAVSEHRVFRLSDEELALLPTEEEVAFYREHGWYLSRRIYSDAELQAGIEAADRFYAGEKSLMPNGQPMKFGWRPEQGDTLRKNDYSSLQNPGLAAFRNKPVLAAIAARLSGSPLIRLWHDQLLWKPVDKPDRKANVGWHTDRGYWKTCTSANMLTAWVPFHECDEKMGSIAFIDGSNHWPDNTNNLNFFSNDLEALEKNFVTGGREVKKITPTIPAGCCTFHHCLTIHGSGPNRSDRPRRSMAIHLQDQTNRWQAYPVAEGKLAGHANDQFDPRDSEGHPDYADPGLHPVLWRE